MKQTQTIKKQGITKPRRQAPPTQILVRVRFQNDAGLKQLSVFVCNVDVVVVTGVGLGHTQTLCANPSTVVKFISHRDTGQTAFMLTQTEK